MLRGIKTGVGWSMDSVEGEVAGSSGPCQQEFVRKTKCRDKDPSSVWEPFIS